MELWEWPQWAAIIIYILNLCIAAVRHGEPRGDHSFPVTIMGAMIGAFILYCGGFF